MIDFYIAIGHGRKPDGTFDPGAQVGGLSEHDLNVEVVSGIRRGLARSGASFYAEDAGGDNTDPNFIGSSTRANVLGARRAIAVHHNASGSAGVASGSEAFYYPGNETGRELGDALATACATFLDIGVRRVDPRAELGFLRRTRMTAVLLEVGFLDGDRDALVAADLVNLGDALAGVLLHHLGRRYTPPGDGDHDHDDLEAHLARLDATTAALQAEVDGLQAHLRGTPQ